MKNSKISVVLVVHRPYLKYLKTAITNLKQCEVIVVANDCQVDIEGVKVVHTAGNLASASNVGVSEAKGPYVMRVDSDDWVEPQILEVLSHKLDEGYDAVWCDYLRANEKGCGVYMLDIAAQEELEHPCGVLYKKSVWEALNGYDETLDRQEGYDFWRRFKRAGYKSYRIPYPYYYYRQHSYQMSRKPGKEEVREMIDSRT